MTTLRPSSRLLSHFDTSRPYICPSCVRRLSTQQRPALNLESASILRSLRRPRQTRLLQTAAGQNSADTVIPFRKQLKDEAKARKLAAKAEGSGGKTSKKSKNPRLEKWELTVGIEIHAELNTARKLFSRATTSISDEPNTHVALFDAAFPGAQAQFQKATLLPALRAAIALACQVQKRSSWDRKHYFYQDQPNGYQITQYYEPFARDGSITLYDHDGIDPADGRSITVGIKQIQMEQDTAKTILQPPSTYLLDFNRVSHPLIEIITLPQIHHPATAAACVRKIQSILKAVDAVTTGMELGGLRADVNVSVRERHQTRNPAATHSYSGVTGLGQRTEIKNLSSFKSIEDAIVAERDRQIDVLEAGGAIEGETRGWTIGSTATTRLRGKEGEVDYRYMPDPDLGAVLVGDDLLHHLRDTLPALPDDTAARLVADYGITLKDAKTLISLQGDRVEYLAEVVERTRAELAATAAAVDTTTTNDNNNNNINNDNNDNNNSDDLASSPKVGRTAANWILHELGGLYASTSTPFTPQRVPALTLASLLAHLLTGRITGRAAKALLAALFAGDARPVAQIVADEKLALRPTSRAEYVTLARAVMVQNAEMVRQVRDAGAEGRGRARGKVMWLVGQMVRGGEEGRVEAGRAREVLEELLLRGDEGGDGSESQ